MKLFLKKFYKKAVAAALIFTAGVLLINFYIGGYKKYYYEVENCANEFGVSLPLILAVVKTESNFNPNAVSKKGAIGLMQVMPKTCEFVCKLYNLDIDNLFEPTFNLMVGTLYLKYLLNKFNDEKLAILAYNAGEGRVFSWLEQGLINQIPIKETKNYYKKIFARKRAYRAIIPT